MSLVFSALNLTNHWSAHNLILSKSLFKTSAAIFGSSTSINREVSSANNLILAFISLNDVVNVNQKCKRTEYSTLRNSMCLNYNISVGLLCLPITSLNEHVQCATHLIIPLWGLYTFCLYVFLS